MSLNWKQFEMGVLWGTLSKLEPFIPYDEVSVKLVGETIWHESDQLRALGQYPRDPVNSVFGPGLGVASIEKPTWDWMIGVAPAGFWGHACDELGMVPYPSYRELAWNLALNVVACRLRYFLDKRPLPPDDLESRSFYWLAVYNGSGVDSRRVKYVKDAKMISWVRP